MKDSKKTKITPKIFLIKTIRIIAISYVTIFLFLLIKQKDMIYYPDYPRKSSFYDCYNFNKEEKKEYNNTRFFEKKWTNKNLVIFFHWNAWAACDRYDLKQLLEKSWNNFIFVEYFWYSDPNKKNKPNLKDILKDVENIWEYINKQNYENIYVMWRSVWTWPASYYTKKFKSDKLLLISPYTQLYKVAKEKYPIFPIKLIMTENYNNEEYLNNFNKNLLIIHWDKDDIIPIHFWQELYEEINTTKKEFFRVENSDHNNLVWKKIVDDKILDFLNN